MSASSSRAAIASALFAAMVAGCSQLLGADFDDGHLQSEASDAAMSADADAASAPDTSTLDAADAADDFPPQVVLFGGTSDSISTYFDDTWTWDGTSWTRHVVTPHPTVNADNILSMAMATFGHTAVLFVGGITQSTWVWDGKGWEHKAPTHSPPAQGDVRMATVGNHVVLFDDTGEEWTWDGVDWTNVSSSGSNHTGHFGFSCVTGSLGRAYARTTDSHDGGAIEDLWFYETDMKWYTAGGFQPSNPCAGLTALANGDLVSLDDQGATWTLGLSTGKYDWTKVKTTANPVLGGTIDPTVAPNETAMVTFGGKPFAFGGGEIGDDFIALMEGTWVFDGGAWTKLPTTVSPPLREWHVMTAIP